MVGGSFDILHVGHIRFLSQAKKLGDILVVGLNSNNIVKKKKGIHRPIVDEKHRAEVLLNLKTVDAVFITREPFSEGVLEILKPDVLVFTVERGRIKSAREQAERTKKQHPNIGIAFLKKEGKKISTTRIEQRILDRN